MLVMPLQSWSRGSFALMAVRDIRAVDCRQTTKQYMGKPHCRTILGVNLKPIAN